MTKDIYFAGGCFWGVEKYFDCIEGVVETDVGYANGKTENPSYEDVCRNGTGHAEAVKVVYDSEKINLEFLLDMFYQVIDPTSVNRQGNDVGEQYRSGIYYVEDEDLPVIRRSLERLQQQYAKPLAVEAKLLENYYPAEEYHQKYLDKNPGGYCHIGSHMFRQASQAKPSQFQAKSKEELRAELTDLEYQVTQENATEPPFRNKYHDNFKEGIYVDITTGEPLFVSTDKFESGCGWPSFSKPIRDSLVVEKSDSTHVLLRTEVRSKTGDAHLGHVFDDGPREQGGLRYCINSASLRFIPKEEMADRGYAAYLSLLDPA